MIAFAANSMLGRAALVETGIDPASFTAVRLASGAAVLWMLTHNNGQTAAGSWKGGALLLAYAAPFSFAYVTLPTGTGALLLFGSVQATMMSAALWHGERPAPLRLTGMVLAACGLMGLLLPGWSAPDPLGALLMIGAGVAWGLYSILGKSSKRALATTAGNFIRASVLWLCAVAAFSACSKLGLSHHSLSADGAGTLLAACSGALTSGLGYALWYAALPRLRATTAAVVQLTVPILAAGLGALFLGEGLSVRLIWTSTLVLGGVALATVSRP